MRVADELAKAMRKGVLKRTRRVRGKAELQRGGDLFAGFPEEMLNWMFLFLITRQYLLTTERTETTDKQKAKTSKRKKKHKNYPQSQGPGTFLIDIVFSSHSHCCRSRSRPYQLWYELDLWVINVSLAEPPGLPDTPSHSFHPA